MNIADPVLSSIHSKSSAHALTARDAALLCSLLLAAAVLRLAYLNADPPLFLSFSAGLFSDEGIYSNDAVSQARFSSWCAGNFHSAVLSPLFYAIQLFVFKVAGTGIVQARLISALTGLASLPVFFALLDRAFDRKSAWIGTALLAVSAPYVLYNRVALIETPIAFALICSAYLLLNQRTGFLSGALLSLGLLLKSTAVLVVPAFVGGTGSISHKKFVPVLAGLLAPLALYSLVWYLPNRAELSRTGHYYVMHQYVPHSLFGVWHNLKRGLFTGEGDGVVPYIVSRDPILALACIIGVAVAGSTRTTADRFFTLWLCIPVASFLLISYTPSRYFVMVWPAIVALAAKGIAAFPRRQGLFLTGLFLVLNVFVLTVCWAQRSYTVGTAANDLARIVPRNSSIAGQFAPTLCMNQPLRAVYVQPGLANDRQPITNLGVNYVLVTRSPFWDDWWSGHAPDIMAPDRLAGVLLLGSRYTIDIYRCSNAPASNLRPKSNALFGDKRR